MNTQFGQLNPHTIGLAMKECVRRAILEIAKQRLYFTSQAKESDYKEEDLVTSADFAAQDIYVKVIDENFPMAGIIAEEKFARTCTDREHTYYFTIDPLDGTKAYGRRQSHAVSTMIAFVFEGKVEGVTIGDPNTREIFHSRPGSDKVHRIYEFENSQTIVIDTAKKLEDQYLQLRCDPRKLSRLAQSFISPGSKTNLFKDCEVIGGSIGITFSRLWKGEVGGMLIEPSSGKQTPWDSAPVFGMSQKMGFKFFELVDGKAIPFEYVPKEENISITNEVLCIHESRIPEFEEWMRAHS